MRLSIINEVTLRLLFISDCANSSRDREAQKRAITGSYCNVNINDISIYSTVRHKYKVSAINTCDGPGSQSV